ncbi:MULTISPECIES: hypothetical protein [Streptacidiphilus]|uniref:Uncharacterized protein n=1 Tax=Streptacidiphilus cavernicola TaxID=3342716 RepID=A0ABV6URI3_9ACTN|nr:hypothetical protein [Streptacidiphilus jeojiense]
MTVDDSWKPEYDSLARGFLKRYFGPHANLAIMFPCMRVDYRWAEHRPRVGDSRVPAKNNTEYHGLERHAWQYHVTAQYEEAYHHFLMAAYCRLGDEDVFGRLDEAHLRAVRFCVRHALFNRDLAVAQAGRRRWPDPAAYAIDEARLDRLARRADDQLTTAFKALLPPSEEHPAPGA